MKCPKCDDDVWVLNNTPEGDACYHCVNKYNLKMIPYHTRFIQKKPRRRKLE